MPNLTKKPLADKHSAAGRRLIKSVKQAVAWANGEDVPVRVTMVSVERASAVDVRSVRRKLGLSQTQFADRKSVKQAVAWANGEDVPVRVTMVSVERASAVDVRSVRRKLGLSQTQF